MGTLVGTKEEILVGHGIISPVSGCTDEPITILLCRYSLYAALLICDSTYCSECSLNKSYETSRWYFLIVEFKMMHFSDELTSRKY